jgi:hypothetical protein
MKGTARRNLPGTKTLLVAFTTLFLTFAASSVSAKQKQSGDDTQSFGGVQSFTSTLSGAGSQLSSTLSGAGSQLSGTLSGTGSQLSGTMSGTGSQLSGILSGAGSQLSGNVSSALQSSQATSSTTPSINQMAQTYIQNGNQSCKAFLSPAQGGANAIDPVTGNPLPGVLSSAGIAAMPTKFPPTPLITFPTQSAAEAKFLQNELSKMSYTGNWPTDNQTSLYASEAAYAAASVSRFPVFAASKAQAEQSAQLTGAGNALAEVAKDQATSAIDYCSKYMINFTVDPSNPWNKLRDQLFLPIGILLFLPGAILSQTQAIVAAGSPVVGEMADGTQVCCFDGWLRALTGIFLFPLTYLIVNVGCDVTKSLIYTCSDEYSRIFNTSMYNDALCGEIRAFPNRSYQENLGGANTAQTTWPQQKITNTASMENQLFESKIDDPCSKQYSAPAGRADELMPSSAVFARTMAFGSNAALTAAWNVLCAFQQVYLLYLFLVGPVIAGLWVWPMAQLRGAFSSWVEGVVTVCFWCLFWNAVIMLMACFKGVSGETGTIMESAFNILATMAVKYGFDFIGLVRAFGESAGQQAMSKGQSGGSGGQGKAGGNGKGSNTAHARAAKSKPAAAAAAGLGPRPYEHRRNHNFGGVIEETDTAGGGGVGGPTGGVVGDGHPGGTISNIHPHAAGTMARPVFVGAGLPPVAPSSTRGQKFSGSTTIKMPNGQTYSMSLAENAQGQQVASLRDAQGNLVGAMNLAQAPGETRFHTTAGDVQLAAAAKGPDWNFTLRTDDGQNGSLSLHNYLGGNAPEVNTAGLPAGVTGIANLADNGTLVRQADGSMAVFSKDSGLHPLVDGRANINGNEIEVGLGNTTGGHEPFLEISQMNANGMTDVAVLSVPAQMIGSADGLNALPLDGTALPKSAPVGEMIGQIPVQHTANGTTIAAGTNYAYNVATNTFDVNGVRLPASVLSPELLREATNHMPSAEATLYALSKPGVADNLIASPYDANAWQAVQQGLTGTGVDLGTLYQAVVQGDPIAGVQVLSQQTHAYPQYAKGIADSLGLQNAGIITDAATNPIAATQLYSAEVQRSAATNPNQEQQIIQRLGVSQTVFKNAASNPFSAAQLLSAELNASRSPEYRQRMANELGVSDSVLSSASQSPIAAAQMVAAETKQNQLFCRETNAALNNCVSQEILACAANNPVAAAQVMAAAAQNDAAYGNQVAQSFGAQSAQSMGAATNNPTIAAQLVGIQSARNPVFAKAVAESVPNLDSRLIREAGQSMLAATQLAAAEAANSPAYARQIAPVMNIYSSEAFNLTSQSPVAAARALGNEAGSNREYASYVANMLHTSPDVVHQAASNPLAAAQVVAAEASRHPSYAAYAKDAMQLNETTIFQAATLNPEAAAQILEADARMHPVLAQELGNALNTPASVVRQVAVNPMSATLISSAQAERNVQGAVFAPANSRAAGNGGTALPQTVVAPANLRTNGNGGTAKQPIVGAPPNLAGTGNGGIALNHSADGTDLNAAQ